MFYTIQKYPDSIRILSGYLVGYYPDTIRYIDHLKWVHVLREDPIHEAILKTRKKFQEEEDMDFSEAVEAGVNQRKYLLNRVFQPMEEPDTDEEDTDESPDESPDDV